MLKEFIYKELRDFEYVTTMVKINIGLMVARGLELVALISGSILKQK